MCWEWAKFQKYNTRCLQLLDASSHSVVLLPATLATDFLSLSPSFKITLQALLRGLANLEIDVDTRVSNALALNFSRTEWLEPPSLLYLRLLRTFVVGCLSPLATNDFGHCGREARQ